MEGGARTRSGSDYQPHGSCLNESPAHWDSMGSADPAPARPGHPASWQPAPSSPWLPGGCLLPWLHKDSPPAPRQAHRHPTLGGQAAHACPQPSVWALLAGFDVLCPLEDPREPHYLSAVSGLWDLWPLACQGKNGGSTGGPISSPQEQDLISPRLLRPQNSLSYLSDSEGPSEPFNTARWLMMKKTETVLLAH